MSGFLMETPQRLPRPHANHLCVKGFLIMLSYSNESSSTRLEETEETGLACLLYIANISADRGEDGGLNER